MAKKQARNLEQTFPWILTIGGMIGNDSCGVRSVMAVVTPEERPAAASVTNVPRSLASATTPLLAGALLDRTTFGWPLIIAGVTKIAYDLTLLVLYHDVPEEEGAHRSRRGGAGRPGAGRLGRGRGNLHHAPPSSRLLKMSSWKPTARS